MTAYRNQRVERSGRSWMGTLSTVLDEIEVCFIPHLYLTSGETEAELLAMAPGIVPLLYSFWGVVFFIHPCRVDDLSRCSDLSGVYPLRMTMPRAFPASCAPCGVFSCSPDSFPRSCLHSFSQLTVRPALLLNCSPLWLPVIHPSVASSGHTLVSSLHGEPD